MQLAYFEIGRQVAERSLHGTQANSRKALQRHLSQEDAGQWLLIFDNVDDMDVWSLGGKSKASSGDWKDHLPRSSQGRIVFTTRSKKIATKLAPKDVIEISEMEETAAMQLFGSSLIKRKRLGDRRNLQKLLRRLTFLPLAIVQAANYINENSISLSEYLRLLDQQEQRVVDLLSKDFEDDWRYPDVKNPVITTWLISFEYVEQHEPLATEYLSLMSCLSPTNIPKSLLPSASSLTEEVEALGTLSAYAFVTRQLGNESFDIHPLVHLATRNWLLQRGRLIEYVQKAIDRLEEVFPTSVYTDDNYERRSIWRAYLAHALYIIEDDHVEKGAKLATSSLAWNLAKSLYCGGRLDAAEKWFSLIAEQREEKFGEEHPETLISLANLAVTYKDQGRWKEAENRLLQVVEKIQKVSGEDDIETLAMKSNLADTYDLQGRFQEAEVLHLQVLETRRRVLAKEDPDIVGSMNKLASTYINLGRYKEAEMLSLQAVETGQKHLQEDHPGLLQSKATLGANYDDQGRFREAENIHLQVLEVRRKVFGEEDLVTAYSLSELSSAYSGQERHEEAATLRLQVLRAKLRILGEEHPETLTVMGNLALSYSKLGRWKEAEELGLRTLKISKRVLGTEHPDNIIIMHNLAFNWKRQRKMAEAISMMEECFRLENLVLGLDHPDIAKTSEILKAWRKETC